MRGPETDVLNRFTNSHRETSAPTHETNTTATSTCWRVPESLDKQIPVAFKLVAGGRQCTTRSTITPAKTCSANLYRHIKRRRDAHLNEHTARGTWAGPEPQLHINYLELKAVFLALKQFQDVCPEQLSTHSHRQHHSGCLYKQGGRDEVGPPMCPSMENPDLMSRRQVTLRA